MILDKEFLFLEKSAYSGCPVSIYRFFKKGKESGKTELLPSLTGIVKFLLGHYNPNECMNAISKAIDINDRQWLMDEYQHLFNYIAAIHFDCEEYLAGAIWAKRAVDNIDILYPYLNEATREKMKKESSGQYMLDYHIEYFDPVLYTEFILGWEINDFIKLKSGVANNNRKRKFRLD